MPTANSRLATSAKTHFAGESLRMCAFVGMRNASTRTNGVVFTGRMGGREGGGGVDFSCVCAWRSEGRPSAQAQRYTTTLLRAIIIIRYTQRERILNE